MVSCNYLQEASADAAPLGQICLDTVKFVLLRAKNRMHGFPACVIRTGRGPRSQSRPVRFVGFAVMRDTKKQVL